MNNIALLETLAIEFPIILMKQALVNTNVRNWYIHKVKRGCHTFYHIRDTTSHRQMTTVVGNIALLERIIERAWQLEVLFI